MEYKNTPQIINNVIDKIDSNALCAYLCAQSGEFFGLYDDGTFITSQDTGNEIDPGERPIACVKCPGINNIDATYYTEEWTLFVGGAYVINETKNARVMTLAECVAECCANGDVQDELDELRDALRASAV